MRMEANGAVVLGAGQLPLIWVSRIKPRRFGEVLPGEIALCSQVRCPARPLSACLPFTGTATSCLALQRITLT